MKLRDQLIDYSEIFLKHKEGCFIFTEHIGHTFREYSAQKKWAYENNLDKGYLMRQLARTLREMHQNPDLIIKISPCIGISSKLFMEDNGFSNKILLDYDWQNPGLSAYCIDGPAFLNNYIRRKQLTRGSKSRKSQYLHPEFPFEEIFTYKGAEAATSRLKAVDHDLESYSHPKNGLHLGAGSLHFAVEANKKLDFLIHDNSRLKEELEKIKQELSDLKNNKKVK